VCVCVYVCVCNSTVLPALAISFPGKAEEDLFIRAGSIRTKEMALNWKRVDLD